MNMEWSNEASLALIEEYRKQPSLWDSKHDMYTCKSYKQDAWKTVAATMDLDVNEVKQKMFSLLGSFRREKARMKKARDTTGSSYSSRWFAFEKMQFLLREDEIDLSGVKLEEEEDTVFEELNSYSIQEPVAPSPVPLKRPKLEETDASDQEEYAIFGQYIACKLRKFDAKTRAFVQRDINNILFEAEMGKYDHLPSPNPLHIS